VIATIHQGLKKDGVNVSINKICRWFGVPQRTVYYKPVKSRPNYWIGADRKSMFLPLLSKLDAPDWRSVFSDVDVQIQSAIVP
jgi:hypothetical protein